jgi:hypothetical protein
MVRIGLVRPRTVRPVSGVCAKSRSRPVPPARRAARAGAFFVAAFFLEAARVLAAGRFFAAGRLPDGFAVFRVVFAFFTVFRADRLAEVRRPAPAGLRDDVFDRRARFAPFALAMSLVLST